MEVKIPVHVEVCMFPSSRADPNAVSQSVQQLLSDQSILYRDHQVDFKTGENPLLEENVQSISVADCDPKNSLYGNRILFWRVQFFIHVFHLYDEGPEDDDEGTESVPTYKEWQLPAIEFHQSWEKSHFESDLKQRLVKYAYTAIKFSELGVNSNVISWNRVVLLHGPPGTGKTSLCFALAQKLAIRFAQRYPQVQIVEVNAHSLFSKWFSESGKLVSRLFGRIQEMAEDEGTLVFVLIDEVESLTSARKAAVSGSEPADAIRAVNALLTQLDALKRCPNVMVLTTSNILESIDSAFLDRADIREYIGPPPLQARYSILRSCVLELGRAGLITADSPPPPPYADAVDGGGGCMAAEPPATLGPAGDVKCNGVHMSDAQAGAVLLETANVCEGMSGRSLRKLPFLAHASTELPDAPCTYVHFCQVLLDAAQREQRNRELFFDRPPG